MSACRVRSLVAAAMLLVPVGALLGQKGSMDLAITVVGEAGERERALVDFLKQHFRSVEFVDRKSGAKIPPADVCVVDWRQGDFQGGFPAPKPACPLGDRSSWTTPTVLIGSAGLQVAEAWDVRGGSG